MKTLWIENRDGGFIMHSGEPHLSTGDDWWHSRAWWYLSDWVARGMLGKNLPGPGQIAEVRCEFETYWEAEEQEGR